MDFITDSIAIQKKKQALCLYCEATGHVNKVGDANEVSKQWLHNNGRHNKFLKNNSDALTLCLTNECPTHLEQKSRTLF